MEKVTVKKLKALSDKTRVKIVETLLKENFCVSALAKELSLSESAVSQHLKILREANLVLGETQGYYTHYVVKREELKNLAEEIKKFAEIERAVLKDKEERDETITIDLSALPSEINEVHIAEGFLRVELIDDDNIGEIMHIVLFIE